MTYYSNWQEIVEFFKKAAEDFRKVGLTPTLNPVVSSTVVPRTYAEHEKFYGDVSSIAWGAIPDRLEPNFYLQTMMHSSFAKLGERNYGHYRSAKFDAACDAQKREMDSEKRVKLVWDAQAVAAADCPIWWLAHPPVISAYNKRDFEGAVEMMGSGYGQVYSPWTYLKIRPRTARKILRSGMQNNFLVTMNPFLRGPVSQPVLHPVFLRHLRHHRPRHEAAPLGGRILESGQPQNHRSGPTKRDEVP